MKKLLIVPIIFIFFGCPENKELKELFFFNKWKITKCSKINNINKLDAYIDLSEVGKGVASVGCNTIIFNYKHSNNEIKVSQLYSTRMYCHDLNKTEKNLKSSLGQISKYKFNGNILTLIGDDVSIECVYRK